MHFRVQGARARHARKACDAAGKVKPGTMAVSSAAASIQQVMESGLKGIGATEDFVKRIDELAAEVCCVCVFV